MKSKEEKLNLLCKEFPDADKDAIQALVLAIDSLAEIRSILDASFVRLKPKPLYQSSVTSMFGKKRAKDDVQSKVQSLISRLEHPNHSDNKPHDNPTNALKKLKLTPNTSKPSKSKIIQLHTPEDVKDYLHPYVSIYKRFLPEDVAERILKHLIANKELFKTKKFYLFDRLCETTSRLAFFYARDTFKKETATYNGKIDKMEQFNGDYLLAAKILTEFVNEQVIPKYPKLEFQRDEYSVSGAIANYYPTLVSDLGWHSDRLQAMGPHCFIGSVSFGATREFRLRRHDDSSVIYSIVVPHNCMILMHPGCQELFKHSVNSMRSPLQVHLLCGAERFSITFRDYPDEFTKHVPRCKCGIPMKLGRSFKSTSNDNYGKYFWSCENTYQNKDCKQFFWADFNNKANKLKSDGTHVSVWKEK